MANSTKSVTLEEYTELLKALKEKLKDYEWVKENLMLEVISADKYKGFLKEAPYLIKEDLAFIARLRISDNMSITVRNFLLKAMGVDKETLFKDAVNTSRQRHPMKILTFPEVLGLPPEESNLLIGTTASNDGIYGRYGASVLLYPEFVEEARKACGGDFFILPSSIHELVLVKYDERIDESQLLTIVKAVNTHEVKPQDRLTDSVYFCESNDFHKIM